MPNDATTLRVVLDRWNELPPGPERERVAHALHVALRALSPAEARGLTADIYRMFREQEPGEPGERRREGE